MKVGEMKTLLEGKDDDRELMIVHQPTYPIQERVHGVYDRRTAGDRELLLNTEENVKCANGCDEPLPTMKMVWRWFEGDAPVFAHEECGDQAMEDEPVYIVAGGQHRERSPYGPREAWED